MTMLPLHCDNKWCWTKFDFRLGCDVQIVSFTPTMGVGEVMEL
jgi:hypothetical protein